MLCLDSTMRGHLTLRPCNKTSSTQRFSCSSAAGTGRTSSCLLQQGGSCVTAQDWNADNVFMAPCSDGQRAAYTSQLYHFSSRISESSRSRSRSRRAKNNNNAIVSGSNGYIGEGGGGGGGGLLSSVHTDFWKAGTVTRCLAATYTPTFDDPAGKPERHASKALPLQLWAKPQPGGALAILILNMYRNQPVKVTVDFATDLNVTCADHDCKFSIRDVWASNGRSAAAPIAPVAPAAPATSVAPVAPAAPAATFLSVEVPGYDSKMYVLSPAS